MVSVFGICVHSVEKAFFYLYPAKSASHSYTSVTIAMTSNSSWGIYGYHSVVITLLSGTSAGLGEPLPPLLQLEFCRSKHARCLLPRRSPRAYPNLSDRRAGHRPPSRL
jgi:hypothetical protein